MSVKLNLTHTYIADMVIVLKAPNGNVFNLDAVINRTGGAGANFVNTVISSSGTTLLSAGAPPYTAHLHLMLPVQHLLQQGLLSLAVLHHLPVTYQM
ncbi:MAG: proprotein convertase P-domain-containing protein [Chitinophagaceae bacterium]|nr:proprotein convertase P-domain-containing protein [Chitinophagaceae bacterium]